MSQPYLPSLLTIYEQLLACFGPRYWWPGESRLEIIVGAILTQGVSWKNVEKAVSSLKNTGNMAFPALLQLDDESLSALIHSAGYHRQKTRKLKTILGWINSRFGGDIDLMLSTPTAELRRELLKLWGIGPETADSILLYAGCHPVFVIDAYTQRIFFRIGLVAEGLDYQDLQSFFMDNLPPQAELYNEYHALLVALGHHYCKKQRPRCGECPLAAGCRYYREQENITRR